MILLAGENYREREAVSGHSPSVIILSTSIYNTGYLAFTCTVDNYGQYNKD